MNIFNSKNEKQFCPFCGKEMIKGVTYCTGCKQDIRDMAKNREASKADSVIEEIMPVSEDIKPIKTPIVETDANVIDEKDPSSVSLKSDSQIVSYKKGLLFNTLTCPVCDKSIKFSNKKLVIKCKNCHAIIVKEGNEYRYHPPKPVLFTDKVLLGVVMGILFFLMIFLGIIEKRDAEEASMASTTQAFEEDNDYVIVDDYASGDDTATEDVDQDVSVSDSNDTDDKATTPTASPSSSTTVATTTTSTVTPSPSSSTSSSSSTTSTSTSASTAPSESTTSTSTTSTTSTPASTTSSTEPSTTTTTNATSTLSSTDTASTTTTTTTASTTDTGTSSTGTTDTGTSTTATPTSEPAAPAPTVNQSQTVYITETGQKYHTAGCRYLSDSCIEVTLDYALSLGLEPCSVCH